jgi:hypothetical protein
MDNCYCITNLAASRCRHYDGQLCNYVPGKSSIRDIIHAKDLVAKTNAHFGFDVTANTRKRIVGDPRKMLIHILRKDFNMELEKIGAIARVPAMGHDSVINAVKKADNLIQYNADFRAAYEALKDVLLSRKNTHKKAMASLCVAIASTIQTDFARAVEMIANLHGMAQNVNSEDF